MELLIFIAIIYFFKNFLNGKNTYKFNVKCPYCNGSVSFQEPGFWLCPHCQQSFHYKPDGRILRAEESINDGLVLLAQLYGKLTKADGAVTPDEIEVMDDIARNELELIPNQRREFGEIFNNNKNNVEDYPRIISNLFSAYNHLPEVLIFILRSLLMLSQVDGGIHPKQEEMIRFAVNTFYPLTNITYDQLIYQDKQKSSHFNDSTSFGSEKYYEILGCSSNSSKDEIKTAYKRLIQKYHPDKYASKDLPEDVVEFATNKFKEIQHAYEEIKTKRNIV